jgi:hypothetical protein
MYIDIANFTLEEVSKITQMLSTARLSAYLKCHDGQAFLYATSKFGQEKKACVLSEIAAI